MRLYLVFCIAFAALCVWAKQEPERERAGRLGAAQATRTIDGSLPSPAGGRGSRERACPPEPPIAQVAFGSVSIVISDIESGAPLDGRVALIRRDAPDRGVELIDVDALAERKRNPIAAGEYQPVVLTDRADAPDPPPIRVEPGEQRFVFPARRRRTFEAFVRITDDRGRVQDGYREGSSSTCELFYLPACYDADEEILECGSAGHVHGDDRPVPLGAHGRHALGPWTEDGRGVTESVSRFLARDGWSRVHVQLGFAPPRECEYRAVAVPLGPIRDSFRLPAGAPEVPIRIRAVVEASLPGASDGPQPVRVWAWAPGYRSIECEFAPAELHRLPVRTFERRPVPVPGE